MVSVLIPVFNGAHYLPSTMDSIFSNSYKNYEVILVDDGSSDNSKKLCLEYQSKYSNVKFVSFDTNKGMVRALNVGIQIASGKYIARINQDDLMIEDRLVKQVDFLEKNPQVVVVGGQVVLFTNENALYDTINFPLTDKELRSRWLALSPFSDPTTMYKRDIFLKTTGYDQNFWPADDVHMWYMMGKLGELANLSDVVTKVRWHAGAGSIKYHKNQIKKTLAVHMWAAKNIKKPDLFTCTFWLLQYVAGSLLPSRLNWYIYRNIKRLGSSLKKAN